MVIKVYADALFIINFIMDYILLCTTAFFAKKPQRVVRTCLASAVGALFASVVFFFPLKPYCLLPLTFLTSLFMVAIVLNKAGGRQFVKQMAIYYLVCFVLGGTSFAFLCLANRYQGVNFLINAGVIYADINAYTLLAVFAVSVAAIHLSCGFIRKQRIKSQYLYRVEIEKNGVCVTDVALFDTGNFLKDPISQKRVILAEWKAVSQLFNTNNLSQLVFENPAEFCYIPCRSAIGASGIFAFTPDKVRLEGALLEEAVLIGVCEKALDTDGRYRFILPNDFHITC
ncbi:MAG: sigma-E processing peptidase SpoIIGA [Oscillospiraceae bacterium]|nr:sigma-E processing peptidase SpoIIGA [Oscillospiraceae bacterium]